MVPNMGLTINHNFLRNTETSDDPTKETIDKYKKNIPVQLLLINTQQILKFLFTFNLSHKIRLAN